LVPDFRAPTYQNWAGFYVGAHVGAGWGSNNWDDRFDVSFSNSYQLSGVLGGIHGGWNYQAGAIVVGAEANLDFSNIRGSGRVININNGEGGGFGDNGTNLKTTTNYLATLVGRGGIANDKWLLYLLAGVAFLNQDHEASCSDTCDPVGGTVRQTVRATNSGYVLGFGGEYAVLHNLSAKLEYNYMGFGKKNLAFPAVEGEPVVLDQQIHVVKLGLSYHFNQPGLPLSK